LGTFEGSVLNAATGEVLFDRAAGTGAATASVMKTLVAASALKVLGPDYQMSTKVYAGSEPGSVVLVGGGDPTLSAGGNSVYKGAPQLSDLAAQVIGARGADDPPITKIVLDSTMWNNSDSWDPSWPANERTIGYQPLIVPLMVDGDRANAGAQTSPRSTDPVAAAGKAFAVALGVSDPEISSGSAVTTNKLLGEVKSQPIKTLIGQMLPNSDNTLADMIARVTSKGAGSDGSAASLTGVFTKALADYGIVAPGLVIKDGSGESKNDSVPPLVIAQLMAKVSAGANSLDVIYNALPVSGKTGTLASRFSGPNAVARGAVNAKTGSIANVYTLGGIVHATDGTALAFAFYAFGNVRSTAMAAIDTVVTGVFKCGDNLSNN
jgi:D-alanyl-D-alanine carboxypeptidase/D-alanyl-D-alanine-endopeptidase (penicillin-binding protein 4)